MTSPLHGARVVLGVTGGIAAYKAVEVCRRLVDAGAHVVPIMTDGARRFVGETTFSALASEKVQTSLWDEDSPIPHTIAGQQADVIVVAPATARLLSDYRTGRSHDLLTATLIATRAPVVVCPAMHTEMWEHPSVEDNLATLRSRGVHVVPPEDGRLAGGDLGKGRLAAPEIIVAAVEAAIARGIEGAPEGRPPQGLTGAGVAGLGDLHGLSVLVTAGGTREPIDPVRYVGNRSSGKQGIAVAEEAFARGAIVTVVSTVDREVTAGIDVVSVETAQEMHDAVMARATACDVVVMAAAVADFRPVDAASHKIKKAGGIPQIVLEPTVDILAALGATKSASQTLVGFAAETDDVVANAASKLAAKGADLLVANDVSAPGVGFEHDTNEVRILGADGAEIHVPLTDKRQIAAAILDCVITMRSTT